MIYTQFNYELSQKSKKKIRRFSKKKKKEKFVFNKNSITIVLNDA